MENPIVLISSLMTILFILMFFGVPIAIALGVSTTINLIIFTDMDLLFIGQNVYAALDSYALLAVPFFILVPRPKSSDQFSGNLIFYTVVT